ncbi:TPA: hypothetical protein ACH3X3_008741 [Trebouxia sp. C0006]
MPAWWCGPTDTKPIDHYTLTPCTAETAGSPIMWLIAAALLYTQIKRVQLLKRHRSYLNLGNYGIREAFVAAALVALTVSHVAWLAFYIWQRQAAYHYLCEATMALYWGAALAVVWQGRQHSVSVHLKFLLWPAAIVYTWVLYTSTRIYLEHWDVASPLERNFLLATACFQTVLGTAAAVTETAKPLQSDEEHILREALLAAGTDPEAPVDSSRKRKSSWYSLLGTAVAYVWPDSVFLQLRAFACVILILIMRVLNLAVPILYKKVVDTLASTSEGTHPRPGDEKEHYQFWQVFYPFVLFYMIAAFLQGGAGTASMGMLNNLRQYLWIPITQDAYRRISLDIFVHTLDLDLNFHLHRKTGELTRIMDRGTNSIQSILSTVIFNIGPQIFDIAAACVYLATALQPWIAVIVFVTLVSYIPVTIYFTEWRGNFRRDLNRLDNAKSAKATDALLNYETVKYFSNEELERRNFEKAIRDYQKVEYTLIASLNGLNVLQSVIIWSGMIGGLIVCTQGVANGSLTVGDAVLFVTLMQQLYAPLNYFGTYYRTIQQYMIDMENMFDLLASAPQIQDKPGAKALQPSEAPSVEFENVSFSYQPNAPVLKDVSFKIEGGQTLALVGATGSGKSSLLRLLFRFYDPTSGVIKIDGQAVGDVTQKSLRAAMAVVPQDTVLFNDTILYNLRYGKPSADDNDVHKSAEAASIHQTITERFPKHYETVVGERGLRLSGGEKQRVAFARALLRNPLILLLDEATSSLDSLTEKRIQDAMEALREQRTTIIVAHRLSTIMDADVIVVLKDGSVVETGTHPELVELGGHYAEMWNRQKETGTIPRSISTASISSATTSRAADGDGSVAGDNPRRVSRGIVGSLFGATQAMLGYGGGGQASHEPSHGAHDSHG